MRDLALANFSSHWAQGKVQVAGIWLCAAGRVGAADPQCSGKASARDPEIEEPLRVVDHEGGARRSSQFPAHHRHDRDAKLVVEDLPPPPGTRSCWGGGGEKPGSRVRTCCRPRPWKGGVSRAGTGP